MFLITNEKILKRILILYLTGTRGGPIRLEILMLIRKAPENTNILSKKLGLDYKTVQHHIRVLEKANLIISSKKKYNNCYELSTLLKSNNQIIEEIYKIWEKVNK